MKYENYLNRLIINEDGNIYRFPGKSIVKDTNRYIFSSDIENDINNIKEKTTKRMMKRMAKPFVICSLNGKYDKEKIINIINICKIICKQIILY